MRRSGFALVLLGCCHAITLPPTPLLALRGGANDRQALVLKGSGLPPLDKVVDACLAGLGLAGSCALLGVMEPRFGVKLFVPPMMASGILFFSPVKPPSPKGILSGTVGCASVSAVVFSLLSGAVSPAAASGAAAGALLMWYKATECIFPPAAVVCVLMAGQAGQASGLKALTSPAGLNWLATTWLGGHACMYAGAMGTAVVRGKARQAIARSKMRQMGNLSRDELRAIFNQFDTSKDGALDALELRCALRVALGVDVSAGDVDRLIGQIDNDGNGVLNFDEFMGICQDKTA
jgi:CBS-domain-containing membrane protein